MTDLKPKDIQDFYTFELKRVSACTVIKYHANIHKALKHAVKMELIPYNPAERVERPKKAPFIGSFYDTDEITKLFEIVKGERIELAVLMGAFYGLRRSEIVGLKWNAIDFHKKTITIRHTVTSANIDGKQTHIAKDKAKNKASLRTLPLVPRFEILLRELKASQEENRRLCKRSYSTEYLGYVYVDELGELIKPDYITTRFPIVLQQNNMRRIRFHDLRHSCASLLLSYGVPMKQIQEWLGHSDFGTTANIYAHLDYSSKISSAEAMAAGLNF